MMAITLNPDFKEVMMLDAEKLRKMAEEEDIPPTEDEELKEALLLQNFQDRFIVPDPSDNLSDDELWALMPEAIRRQA